MKCGDQVMSLPDNPEVVEYFFPHFIFVRLGNMVPFMDKIAIAIANALCNSIL